MATAFLVYMNGKFKGKPCELSGDRFVVGQDTTRCHIVTDPRIRTVSGVHAAIISSDEGWDIEDIGSTGEGSHFGTYVNGDRLEPNRRKALRPNDEIRLGSSQTGQYFKLRYGSMRYWGAEEADTIGGRLMVDKETRTVLLDNRALPVHLSPLPFNLLSLLWEEQGKVCEFTVIKDHLWPPGYKPGLSDAPEDVRTRIIQLIKEVREALAPALGSVEIIQSLPGVGYRLRKD